MAGSPRRTARVIVMLALTLPSMGCISFETHPEREVRFELTGAAGSSPSEWWVLSWQDQSKCDIGLVWGFPHGGPFEWPYTLSRSQVRLFHMTPETPTMTWTGSYDWYLWYLADAFNALFRPVDVINTVQRMHAISVASSPAPAPLPRAACCPG